YYSRISGSDVLVNTVEIEYRSNGNIYKIYSAVDDERIIFLFDSDDKIYKIIKIKTAADIDVVFAYQHGDKTVRFRHWGRDEQNGTSDDTYNVYSCDNYGRVISSYVTDYNGKVLGSSAVSYNNAEGTKKHNTVAESAFKNVSSENLFEHSGFEAYTNDSFFQLFSSWMAI
ncbi:MAG: hypothetical protein II313_01740, partial [Anaerotignum sp.]|nr:hypothetical protein [Anaerotignum sp.]